MLNARGSTVRNHGLQVLRWSARAAAGLAALLAGYWILVFLVQDDLRQNNKTVLYPLTAQTDKALETLHQLEQIGSGGCSPARIESMRGIALLPDGIHIVMYITGDTITCASNIGRIPAGISLGPPDLKVGAPIDVRIWLEQPLDDFGFHGERAMIASRGNYAVAYRAETVTPSKSDWFGQEVYFRQGERVFVSPTGERKLNDLIGGNILDGYLFSGSLGSRLDCDKHDLICAVSTANIGALLRHWLPTIGLIAFAVVFAAALLVHHLEQFLRRHWSFERRFLRNMTKRIECVYQPILDIDTGAVTGCEVLARWRDVDGELAAPDTFLRIVESNDRTRTFTRAVVDKSLTDLRTILPVTGRLQINYNIFPRDFSVERLKGVLIERNDLPAGASIAVEVIEVEQLDLQTLARETALLGAHGLKTYIDDFGSGYSNLAALATLPVTGIKLDKSFGLASADSLQARMLPEVLDLIAATNHQIIVEGVETAARLEELRETGHVDMVQGYYFSAPLTADAFLAWVCEARLDTLKQEIGHAAEAGPGDAAATRPIRAVR